MLEAKLEQAAILKRLLDAIKELVADANFECNEEGIQLQAMDNSHVALVAVQLKEEGFENYRCDRPMPLGVNLTSLTKVLKCAKDDDVCTLKAGGDNTDTLSLVYEARNTDRIAEYELKLMDIDSDKLGIPETDYDARVTLPSAEFSRIVRDLSQLGESVRIEVSKEGVRFTSEGEAANGSVLLKQSDAIGKVPKKEEDDDDDEEKEEKEDAEEDGDDDDEEKPKVKKEKKDKKKKVKKEDDDVEMDGDEEEEYKDKGSDDEGEEEQDDEDSPSKKRKRAASSKDKGKKKAKRSKDDEEDELPDGVRIEMNQSVNLTFSLKYLVNFSKSSSLSSVVQLMLSNDVPLLVSYEFGQGHIRYYLAPKIGDE
ncbi:hypothetical protein QCA50_003696 [Cerrena zonata]|uniref:DNA sliding clamp PCNA n=1 Tax=Cerrena zonata TaxID=2478898 RepID=A0AAW0GWV6_9APHY